MKFSVVFGSQARGDFNESSDFDVLLINLNKKDFNYSIVPEKFSEKVDFVEYTEEEFLSFYENGSLFLYHILNQGILLDGSTKEWEALKGGFKVQKDFSEELEKIWYNSKIINNICAFGGKYLTPLSNIFTELKNASIFSLAHKGVYEFNKSNCLKMALPEGLYSSELENVKHFYNYIVRGQGELPFLPNDEEKAVCLLRKSVNSIEWLKNDCCARNN